MTENVPLDPEVTHRIAAKIQGVVQKAAAEYVRRERAGSSDSMNGALDYLEHTVIREVAAELAALSRAPEAGREGAAERLAIVAEKPAHLIRWGEGDRLDLQSVLAALSPPSTGGEGEAVAWRCLNVHGDAFLTEHANGAYFWAKSGKPVQPLYLHPSPEMGEISRETLARTINPWAFAIGHGYQVKELQKLEAYAKADAILLKLKENGLSREGLGGDQPAPVVRGQGPNPVLTDGSLSDGWVAFNINDYLRIRLTEAGREAMLLNHHALYQHTAKMPEFVEPTPDADGWLKMQAWEVMREFGRHIHMTGPVPFETTIQIAWTIPAKTAPSGPQRSEVSPQAPDSPLPPSETNPHG